MSCLTLKLVSSRHVMMMMMISNQGRRHLSSRGTSHGDRPLASRRKLSSHRVTWRPLVSRRKLCRGESRHRVTWRPLVSRRKLSSRVTSHHMATDLSHYMTAETVESSRGKDNKQHLDENRLTLTYNKRRSPFHIFPTAERLGATGGEPTVHIKHEMVPLCSP